MRHFATLLLLLMLGMISACGPDKRAEAPKSGTPGVTESEVRIGSSLPLSGHASYLGIETLKGATAYLDYVNENGGVHGRKITLIAKDDGYDPPRCLMNTQQFLIEDDAFALFCYVGTPTTLKILPLVDEAQIPILGMFTGANALREPFNRQIFNIRASYYKETDQAVKHLVEDLGLKNIGVLYQYDAYGFDGLTGTELALKKYGLAPVARGTYIRGTTDIQDGLDRIRESGASAVVIIATYESAAKFISRATESGFNPVFYAVSFVGAEELARRLGDVQAVVVMSQVVPPPDDFETLSQLPGVREYSELLARRYPDSKPNVVGLEAFVNAKVLVEGLNRAGLNLTRESFINAVESITDFPVGLDTPVSFAPRDHQGLEQVYFTAFKNGHFELLDDWSELWREPEKPLPAGESAHSQSVGDRPR